MVSSIQLSFHLIKKLQGGISFVWGNKAVSQGRGYLPACLGQLFRHGSRDGDTLGKSGQSCCSCCGSAVLCKRLTWTSSSWAAWDISPDFGQSAAFGGIPQLFVFCSGTWYASSMPLLPSLGSHRLQFTHTSLPSQGSLIFACAPLQAQFLSTNGGFNTE